MQAVNTGITASTDQPSANQTKKETQEGGTSTGQAKAKRSSADAEFARALSIIEQTQLTIFRETGVKSRTEIMQQLEVQTAPASPDENTNGDIPQPTEELRMDTMRKLLSETINSYEDTFANYIDPQQLKKYRERRSGGYVGIGLKFRAVKDEYPWVIGALLGGPLDDSEIAPGDRLLKADDKDLKGKTSKQILALLKGPANTELQLTLTHESSQPYTVTVKRQAVALRYARSQIVADDIGYIKISRFGGKTHELVGQLVRDLLDKNVSAFILDLRDNPGGSTLAARAIVSMFSTQETVYCEKYKSSKTRDLPRHGEHLTDKPLVVLVNGNSMSSSEIVAGAIKTYKRGTIIGSPTYGKGLVQKVFNLKPPLGGAIRTTIAVFGRPDHELIHGVGVLPDIYLKTAADFMFRQTGSLNISAAAMDFHRLLLEQSVTKKHPDKAAQLIAATDAQLQKAIEVLHTEVEKNGSM